MSIYSGFPTREDEKNYNKLLSKLILTLQAQVLELTHGVIPPCYLSRYQRTISRMQGYEEHKYLPPKFTELLIPLIQAMSPKQLLDNTQVDLPQTQTESRLQALAEVKEEEEEPSSSRKLKSAKTQMSIRVKKSMPRYRKVTHKSILTDTGEEPTKENKARSYSLFSNQDKGLPLRASDDKLWPLRVSEQGGPKNCPIYRGEGRLGKIDRGRFVQGRYGSTSKRLPKTKTAEGARFNREVPQEEVGKTMDQIMKINRGSLEG